MKKIQNENMDGTPLSTALGLFHPDPVSNTVGPGTFTLPDALADDLLQTPKWHAPVDAPKKRNQVTMGARTADDFAKVVEENLKLSSEVEKLRQVLAHEVAKNEAMNADFSQQYGALQTRYREAEEKLEALVAEVDGLKAAAAPPKAAEKPAKAVAVTEPAPAEPEAPSEPEEPAAKPSKPARRPH